MSQVQGTVGGYDQCGCLFNDPRPGLYPLEEGFCLATMALRYPLLSSYLSSRPESEPPIGAGLHTATVLLETELDPQSYVEACNLASDLLGA